MPYKDPELARAANRKSYLKHRAARLEKCRQYYEVNREAKLEYFKSRYRQNPAHVRKICKRWEQANKDKINEAKRQHRKDDPSCAIACNLRSRLTVALRRCNALKSVHLIELLGCSLDELISWLEARFYGGMNWDNYGKWHVDHIQPCSSFDLTSLEEQRRCFHYTNLQPLWALDNLRKGAQLVVVG